MHDSINLVLLNKQTNKQTSKQTNAERCLFYAWIVTLQKRRSLFASQSGGLHHVAF